jgi:hypothetical protein
MCGEDTPHYIFIDVDSERFVDLLCDPRASEPWLASFQLNDGLDEFLRWSLGAGFPFTVR